MATIDVEPQIVPMPKDTPTPFEEETPRPAPASSQLYEARTVLLFGEITPTLAERVSTQLIALASQGRAPIKLFINSPGGHVESGDTLHDLLGYLEPEVIVIGTGWVASAAALVYAGAPRTRRLALPNTRFLLHEPRGGVGGQATDVEIEARQIIAMRGRLNRIFAEATGQPIDKVARDCERNYWMDAAEALAYGLVGRVVASAAETR